MRKSMNMQHRNIRWKLMSTVSALALCASVYGASEAHATDPDRPTLWIELGAQFEKMRGLGDPYAPPFTSALISDGFASPLKIQRELSQSFGGDGTISFQPESSDWIFSASIRYGRASGGTKTHEQTPGCPCKVHIGTYYPPTPVYLTPSAAGHNFSETRPSNSEVHTLLDFQVGKDIGLGMLGKESRSTIGFGVRFAQFSSKQIVGIDADPDDVLPSDLKYAWHHHTYQVRSHVERSFRGLGPSLSWTASAPLLGNPEDGEIGLDWGVNAAVLFGRQRMHGHHQTVGDYYKTGFFVGHFNSHLPTRSGNPARTKSVTVPNLGGFAGLSLDWANAKLSLGYRGDFFFGAMDGGMDTRHSTTRGFYGPFASISVGLGD